MARHQCPGPGHADYVKNMITGATQLHYRNNHYIPLQLVLDRSMPGPCYAEAAQMDGAILVVSGSLFVAVDLRTASAVQDTMALCHRPESTSCSPSKLECRSPGLAVAGSA